jgi:tetratricopeptide (TPR) repeat protein
MTIKQSTISKKFRPYPEELAAILFALLVIAHLILPDLVNRLPEFVKVLFVFLAVVMFPGFLITSWITSLRKMILRRAVYSFTLGYAVWAIPFSILMIIEPTWSALYATYFTINLLLIALTIYFRRFRPQRSNADDIREPASPSWKKASSLVLLGLLLVSFIPLISIARTEYVSGDLMSFITSLRTSIHSTHFNQTEPLFGTGYPVSLRMRINPWCVLPAFMVKESGVDPLYFFSRNLPIIFVIFAILAIYLLVMEFTGNRDLALFTSLFSVVLFLANPYPNLFNPSMDVFRRITADKFFLLYIILPPGLAFGHRYFTLGCRYALFLACIVGLAIGLTHPLIVLFFLISTATFVTVSFLLLRRYRNRIIFKRAIALAAMCLLVLIVPVLQQLRYASSASQLYVDDFDQMPLQPTTTLLTPYVAVHNLGIPGSHAPEIKPTKPGEVNPLTVVRLYSQIGGKKLLLLSSNRYISHPSVLINWPSLLAIAFTPLLLIWARKDDLSLLMISTTLVYLFLSFNPILTPLIGRFITPWMVYRLTWPIMVHFTLAYLLYRFIYFLAMPLNKARPVALHLVGSLLPVVFLLAMAVILRSHIEEYYHQIVDAETQDLIFSDNLITFMREHIDGKDAVILSDLQTNPSITAVLYRTYVVAHRYNTTSEVFPADKQDEAIQRLYDVEYFTNARLVDSRMMEIINTYHVKYILLSVTSPLTCQFPFLENFFKLLYSDDQYQLLQVNGTSLDNQAIQGNNSLLSENYIQAEIDFTGALQQSTGNVVAYLGLSTALQGQGQISEALKIAKEALNQYPQSICINRLLGNLYIDVGDKNQAAQQYHTVASLDSKESSDYKTLGNLFWLLNQSDEAESAYQKTAGILFGAQTKQYYQYLYGLYLRLGDQQRADHYIKAALDLGPTADTYIIAGYAAAQAGSDEEAALLITQAIQSDPDAGYLIAAYVALGNLYLGEDKYDEAIATYQQGIRQGFYKMDWGTDSYIRIGNVYDQMGNTEQALAYYKDLEHYDPASSGPYLAAAQIYKSQDHLQAALAEYEKATFANPFDTTAYLQAAEIYQQLGMEEQMLNMFQRALSLDPFNDKAWLIYGYRLLSLKDTNDALQAFKQALELNSTNASIYVGLGTVALAEQHWENTLADFRQAIIRSPLSSQGYIALGDTLVEISALNNAVDAYTQAIKVDPGNPAAYAKLSNTYRLLGELDKASEIDQTALKVLPDSVDVLLSLANTYQAQKRYDQAVELYHRVLELDPKQVRPYLSLADIAMVQSNDQSTALELHQKAVNENPTDVQVITALGDFYFQQGHLDLAEQAYRLVLGNSNISASTYLAVSNIQQMRGDWDQAMLTLQAAVNQANDPANAYRNLAVYYIGRGFTDEAVTAYQAAIHSDPKNGQNYAGLVGLAINLGNLNLAVQTLEQGAQNAEDQSAIHSARAAYLKAIGDPEKAEDELLAAILPPVKSTDPYQNLAQFYRDTRRFQDAISIYEQGLSVFPDNLQLMIGLGETYAAIDRTEDAVRLFQLAASSDKSNSTPDLSLASLYFSQSKLLDAERAAQHALTIQPANSKAYLLLAQIYNELQHPDQARWAYEEACRLNHSQADCLVGLSKLDWQVRNYDQSIADMQAAISAQPSRIELYQSMAQDYQSLGDHTNAEQTLSSAISIALDRETAWLARAGFYNSLGLWNQAEADYLSATQAYPYSQDAGLQLASFYATRDNVPRALSILLDFINLHTAGAAVYNNLGDLYTNTAVWGEAIDAYKHALLVDPQYSQAAIGMARVLNNLGRREEALSTLQDVANAAPKDVKLLLALGETYLSTLDYQSARGAFSQALEIDPNSASALADMDNLEIIEGKSSEALNRLVQLAQDRPSADTYEILAAQYQARGEWNEALSWRQYATALEPFNGIVWLNLANQYLTLQDLYNAEPALAKAAQYLPVSPAVLLATGTLKEGQGKDAEAETYYNRAIDASPNQIGAYVALANLKSKQGDSSSTLQILRNGLEHAPATALVYETLGNYYSSQKDYQTAIESYQEGLNVMPGAVELMVSQGNVYIDEYFTAKVELATAKALYKAYMYYYEKTLLMPNRDWAIPIKADALTNFLYSQGRVTYAQTTLDMAKSSTETASAQFKLAMDIQPNSTAALIGLGKVSEINEQWQEATQYYQQGLSINPNSVDLWNALGQFYLLNGNAVEARNAFRNAINLLPNNQQASYGIITATKTLSAWSLTQALDNAAYSQYRWTAIVEYYRNSGN